MPIFLLVLLFESDFAKASLRGVVTGEFLVKNPSSPKYSILR